METQESNKITNKQTTGIKTIDRLVDIPIVNTAFANVTDYYGRVKDKNFLLRTSCNLAELSFRTMAFAATPLTSLAKKPILSVDSYLCEKVDELEHTYPIIAKPTEQLAADVNNQAKEVYDKTLKVPIETLNSMKEKTVAYGTDTMHSVMKKGSSSLNSVYLYSYEKMHETADFGIKKVDSMLENKFAKLLAKPVVDFYEKSVHYLIPAEGDADQSNTNGDDSTTLRRIFDINNRVYKHLYQTTFTQLSILHHQFESYIKRLQAIKDVIEFSYADSKERINSTFTSVKKNTLVSQCASYIDKNKISLHKIDIIAKVYSNAILVDIKHMLDKYMGLVKNFPVVFNGSKLKQSLETLINQINKDSFATFLTSTIEQLKKMNATLMAYTTQMLQVVSHQGKVTTEANTTAKDSRTNEQNQNTNDLLTLQPLQSQQQCQAKAQEVICNTSNEEKNQDPILQQHTKQQHHSNSPINSNIYSSNEIQPQPSGISLAHLIINPSPTVITTNLNETLINENEKNSTISVKDLEQKIIEERKKSIQEEDNFEDDEEEKDDDDERSVTSVAKSRIEGKLSEKMNRRSKKQKAKQKSIFSIPVSSSTDTSSELSQSQIDRLISAISVNTSGDSSISQRNETPNSEQFMSPNNDDSNSGFYKNVYYDQFLEQDLEQTKQNQNEHISLEKEYVD